MKTTLTQRPSANEHKDDIRREAIKAIQECLNAAALTERIDRYTDPTERLRFIRAARTYYNQQINDGKEAGVSQCLDALVPRLGDLTEYFKGHETQAEAELQEEEKASCSQAHERATKTIISPRSQASCNPKQLKTTGKTDGQRAMDGQSPEQRAKTKDNSPNTQIHMTINNYGGTQNIFEAGATQHIERLICTSAPEEEGTEQCSYENDGQSPNENENQAQSAEAGNSTPAEPAATLNNQEKQAHRFPYFSREATEKDKQEFEQQLREAASKGNRYVVDLFNSYSYYLDLRGVRTTDLLREMQQWGLTSKYDAFQKAMLKCRCIR